MALPQLSKLMTGVRFPLPAHLYVLRLYLGESQKKTIGFIGIKCLLCEIKKPELLFWLIYFLLAVFLANNPFPMIESAELLLGCQAEPR